MNAALVFILSASIWLAESTPAGMEPVPVHLDVAPDAAADVPPEALAIALAVEVGIVTRQPAEPAHGSLTIGREDTCHFFMRYRDASGSEISRSVAAMGTPRATIETIALIAGNLIRNEADELIGEHVPPKSAAPTAIQAPATPLRTLEPPGTPAVSVSRVRAGLGRAAAHPWSIGLIGYLSPSSASRVVVTGSGLVVARRASRHLALGVTDLASFPQGGHTVVSGGPFVEGSSFVVERLQVFGQVGVPVQAAWGGHQDPSLSAALFVAGGLRFWFGRQTSIAAGARLSRVVTGEAAAPSDALVAGTVFVGGGLELAYHF